MRDIITLTSGTTIQGSPVAVTPLMPWSYGGSPILASNYRKRNSGKSRLVWRYTGIPYAEQPVGDLRWKPAVYKASPDVAVFDARDWAPIPYQTNSLVNGAAYTDTPWRPSSGVNRGHQEWANGYHTWFGEDCLTLNIWAPDGADGLPVIIYFHGGGWVQNASCMHSMHGHRLAVRGVVYVSVEYRLSTLGFFYHPAFSGEAGVKGNLALTDHHAALQWVHDNISAFGGDPANVTIMGSSAGGAAVLAHMETTQHTGLFHKAWVISGGGGGYRTRLTGVVDSAEYRGRKFEHYLMRRSKIAHSDPRTIGTIETEDGLATALRRGPTPQEIMAFTNARNGAYTKLGQGSVEQSSIGSMNYFPFMDGTFLTYDRSIQAFEDAACKVIPLVIGFATNEASVIGMRNEDDPATYNIRRGLASLVSTNVEDAIAACYPGITDPVELARIGYRDIVYGYPAWAIAHAHRAVTPNTWMYVWDYVAPGNAVELAGHTTDRNFWFGQLEWSVGLGTGRTGLLEAKINIQDLLLSEYMSQLLVNYAKYGNPNGKSGTYEDYKYDNDLWLFDLNDPDNRLPGDFWNAFDVSTHRMLKLSQVGGVGSGGWFNVNMTATDEDYLGTQFGYFHSNRSY